MALSEYLRKRNFRRTSEPAGGGAPARPGTFVVQKHDASRLHYDFRIELDGALKSWAVPKGPSRDPADRRFAVHVEDHPLEYADFEGTIPAGEYGGGSVMIWDRGYWEPQQTHPLEAYGEGNLKLTLHGRRLRGGFALVKLKSREAGPQDWLLVKERDAFAAADDRDMLLAEYETSLTTGRTMTEIAEAAPPRVPPLIERIAALPAARKRAIPTSFKPQLAQPARQAPPEDHWLNEIKFDGYRMLGRRAGDEIRLISRRARDWTAVFPRLVRPLYHLPADDFIIDGEIVAVRPDGSTDFHALQNAAADPAKQGALVWYVFDLPFCAGYDLCRVPLYQRKALLYDLLGADSFGPLRFSAHIEGNGPAVYARAADLGAEGIISKQRDSRYEQKRSPTWLKIKRATRREFIIVGYTDPAGSRHGLGAVLLGAFDKHGLRLCGKAGSGFSDQALERTYNALTAREQADCPVYNPPTGREARSIHWVRPELTCEVEFAEWTGTRQLRAPVFQRLMPPRDITEVRIDLPDVPEPPAPRQVAAMSSAAGKNRHVVSERRNPDDAEVAGVRISNPGREVFPEVRITKQDLAEFYTGIADWILPHVTHRPLSVVRCPKGRGESCFYQKHVNETLSEPIRSVAIRETEGKRDYIMIEDLSGLIALVQFGVLEIHPWGSRADKPDKPDRMIFDLDPGPSVGFSAIRDAARALGELLDHLGLQAFLKTSGGKGLHVVVPITRRNSWDEVRSFAEAVSRHFESTAPKQFTANARKAERSGRIYMDYLRNARGATSVAAYSTRAKPGAPISTPLTWDELANLDDPAAYTMENLRQRLRALRDDPWKGFFDVRQSVTKKARNALGD